MKKLNLLFSAAAFILTGCNAGSSDTSKTITICASEVPHEVVLTNAVKPLLAEKGYTLKVTVLDWSIQNDGVKNGDYDANYFQHRPYLIDFNKTGASFSTDFTYSTVFPTAAVHFEPLSVYAGKSSSSEFESKKTTATYEICNDATNACRALDLLVENGVISSYEKDNEGNPINLPKNITMISEELLAASLSDYDYGVLPCNTALTANLTRDTALPTESDSVADLRANVIAANVTKYKTDETYKTKIDALTDAVLDASVGTYISNTYKNVIKPYLKDLRSISKI